MSETGAKNANPVDCSIPNEHFPHWGVCCRKSHSVNGTVYQPVCPACSIWRSLPDAASLEVSYILDCSRYGYGKRVKAKEQL